MPKSSVRKPLHHKKVVKKHDSPVTRYTRVAKKDIKSRFRKAEYAALGIVLFILVLFPSAIIVSGLVAYGAYKYWQHRH